MLINKNKKSPILIVYLPNLPLGRNTDKEKNPFHKVIKIGKDINPHTGQIAINRETTATTPTTAPIGTNLGLYYSNDLTPKNIGRTKVE